MSENRQIVIVSPKSVGISVILTVLLGPLGLFYSSIWGGIIMSLAWVIIGIITLGFGLIIPYIIGIVWGVMAVSSYNHNLQGQQ